MVRVEEINLIIIPSAGLLQVLAVSDLFFASCFPYILGVLDVLHGPYGAKEP